ncbi:MAG TPA: hypothetical protein VI564_02940 [Candidatus Nanoarchaeia archaeon]|nr:hypothetical protein [Candidatus Nanoarchaeia archaeon]
MKKGHGFEIKALDKSLKQYIKRNSAKGHSHKAIKQHLSNHGYDEDYIQTLIDRHKLNQFLNAYVPIACAIFIFSILIVNTSFEKQKITGFAVSSEKTNNTCTLLEEKKCADENCNAEKLAEHKKVCENNQ